MVLTRRIEHPLDMTVQRPHDADARKHRRTAQRRTRIKASIAVCHSAASCSAFGSFVMYLPTSSRVTRRRLRGNGIGSSKRRFHPRSATGFDRHRSAVYASGFISVVSQPNGFAKVRDLWGGEL
jgi:hypothetical protein